MDNWLAARLWAWLGLGWPGFGYDSHAINNKKKLVILFALHLLLFLRHEQQSTPKSSTPKNCSASPEPGQSQRPVLCMWFPKHVFLMQTSTAKFE